MTPSRFLIFLLSYLPCFVSFASFSREKRERSDPRLVSFNQAMAKAARERRVGEAEAIMAEVQAKGQEDSGDPPVVGPGSRVRPSGWNPGRPHRDLRRLREDG